ncbi:unnamed protein product (macronuclear) [Paramecium tetraurelia]|uniref:EGF-like domain-containing protein n=1 Tax=Paramecium tetraurelia TaxID=5888 RepID=A0DBS1_PARTE|nr:uncharacterized protein GSPATT00015385001 [Paramecium tetraurelia]CAK80488.1 unnamed protein product [Paramecium tetraurelia]|eukprot:XP_001447885.1 hypothetical protein (macronuclear) [Paramecium tetraurelia strain d4-2]
MLYPIFATILYLNSIIQVLGVSEVISSSFQGNSFSNADNWVVRGGQPVFTDCMGTRLFGGYQAFARQISVTKTFLLPPHFQVNLQLQYWKIDSWDAEFANIFVDYQLAWQQQYNYYDGTQMCGGGWQDLFVNLNLKIKHSGNTAVIVITTNLDETPDNESWGFRDFILSVEKCPDGCLACQQTDTDLQCAIWKTLQTSWTQLNQNQILSDGWNVLNGIPQATSCGAVTLFGGYNLLAAGAVISKTFLNIPPHHKLKIQFLWAKIDSYDNEAGQMRVDGVLLWERRFQWYEGYYWKICGNLNEQHRTIFVRNELDLSHTNSQVQISFTSTLDEPQGESFGLRDFVIFYGACTSNCAKCTGPSGSECQGCVKGSYNTGVIDSICQLCYPSCYLCEGQNIDDCIDCGDPNIYNKQLVDGQCICVRKTVEQTQIDGTTICLPCHPRCERCQWPFDNSANQYCSMCIAGQNRIVSDQLNCVCKPGYGEDGISEICFRCHYTCENCNGPLATNCTTCSSSSKRHLTSDNQCLCNKSYNDTGTNDINCLYICHYTCSDCDLSGEDQCTSCPATRQPDRIGTTFKCLCKDSHYFSDKTELECLECHFTCKTCNGSQNNNCLTCNTTYRQLAMFKCICPDGYYDIGLLQCSPCHYTCLTCFGPALDNCLTCASSNNREFKTNTCSCQNNYLEKQVGDPMCYSCSYRCANCSGTIDNCTSCPLYSYRDLGTNNSCSCPAKTYDQPNNPICIVCHSTCLTCNGAQSNQCTSCYTQIMRQLDSSGSCLCMSKYYDPGKPECIACSAYCLNCVSSADNCISCKPDRYLQGNVCNCKTKSTGATISSYQVQGKVDCCHYSCLECNGSKLNQCTKCMASEMRVLSNSTCPCSPHYFDMGKPMCQQCNYSCETCAGFETTCLTCYQNSFRTLTNQQCLCQKGYFDDGSNSTCQKCHYSCSQCSSISTKCDTCSLTSNRILNLQMFTCNCSDSYYDVGVETCAKCHYSCFTCNQSGYQFCQSCVDKSTSFRVFNQGVCQCLPGYYDDGLSPNCNKCQSSCLTCQNTADYCTSCEATRYLEGNTCPCYSGYFLNNLGKCSKCNQNCVNCTTSSTYCIECDLSLMRILDTTTQTCICKPGTTEINGLCQVCDITCQTCQNSITNCTSCKILRLLSKNQCKCIDGTYESGNDKQCLFCDQSCFTCINQQNYCTSCSADKNRILLTGNVCICQDGYYEDSVTLSCKPCDKSCLTCKVSPTYCLTCDASYNLSLNNQNRCVCSTGFYFNTTTLKCEACNISCTECKTLTQCLQCETITRYFDSDNLKCPCKDGYFEVNQKKCSICDLSCKTCINSATKCLSCEPTYFRLLNNSNQCICSDGYYDVGIEMCQLCSPYCQTCVKTSTKCTSCNQQQHFRVLNVNQCICQNGYYDNGQVICQTCSNQCLTCQGRKDVCTSCDTNQNRIDQSVINKCPCSSGFYSDENETCQKCHLKCQTCSLSQESCISCSISTNSNRQSISQNCICKDGYYDDGTQIDCQKCAIRCKLCQNSSSNCLTCFSNLREGPPLCNCKIGFFENSSLSCEPCENQCQTCEKNSTNCLSCKEGRSTKQCVCQDGYYEGGQPLCVQCSFSCKTCKDSQINCLSCKGDRINIPTCSCPDGFYDDYVNESCQVCDGLCKTCNIDGCLTCNGNRVLTSEMTCEQPPNSVSHPDTPWCSTCQVAVIDIRFSDDLLSIQVKFDFTLNPQFFTTQFSDNVCLLILEKQTYQSLGKNPSCYIDPADDTKLILRVGNSPKILPGDKILFYDSYFGHEECDKKLSVFIFNYVKSPISPVSPIIIYDLPTYLINPCDDNTISLRSKLNDGLRGFIEIKWTYSVDGSNGNGDLDNFVALLTKLQILELVIPLQTLPKQSKITFYLDFQNFVGQKSIQKIKLETHSGQFPTILWISKSIYFNFETIVLEFLIKKKDCSEQAATTQVDNSEYSVSLVEVYRNESNSRPSRVNYSEITRQSSFNVIIQNYTLTSRISYTFEQTTFDALMNFSIKRNITIDISSGGILCQFNGTKKIQNYRKETYIFISCKDLDTQYGWNEDTGISLNVECADLTMNSLCLDLNKKIIQINKTDSIQVIPKQTIKPYTIQSWSVVATKKQHSYKFKQNIVYLDNDFKLLNVTYSKGYLMRGINNYENLEFIINIPFEDRQYLLEYQVAIIYNFQLVQILQSEYFQQQIRIFDYFQEFTKGDKINLKFLAQFTNEIIPSQEDLQINVNQPPNCLVSLSEQTVEALKLQKVITICDFSESAPFTYQLRYFLHKQDLIDFQNRTNDYSLILSSYSSSYTIEATFPFIDGILLIQAMDSKGSYLNIEKQLNITKTLLNCSENNIKQYNLKYKISLLLEIILNHYDQQNCITLSNLLYSNIQTYLGADNIDDQLLVYQTTKLYKRIIQDHKDSNSSMRLLNENSGSCFENSTQAFYVKFANVNTSLTVTPSSLQAELKQIMSVAQKMIKKSADYNDQILQNEVFLDEKIYQKRVAIIDSLSVIQLLIDDIFLKIPEATINSNSDKESIINTAEGLISLIEKIAIYVNVQVKVNGPQLINNGQILKWQLSKITKEMLNKQFNIERDLLDGLIDFVQKEQIELNYNYLNLSQQLQAQLQVFFNLTNLEINEKALKKTNLQNHLYNGRYIDYQSSLKQYIIDMLKISYCQELVPQDKLYSYGCVNIDKDGKFYKCELSNEEIDNKTVQISCKCEQLGSIILIQYPNNSVKQQNISIYTQNEKVIKDNNLMLNEQPILLFHGIFIAFSYFIYFELVSIEIKQKHTPLNSRIDSEFSMDETHIQGKPKIFHFYPGTVAVFKISFKFIHEILSCFYTQNSILKKSYHFLQLSVKIGMLIPISFLEITLLDETTLFAIFIINCGTFLIFRMILKILQSIYRFGGKLSILIIIIYLLIHFLCYLEFILQLKQCEQDLKIINFEISLFLIGSLFQFYVILDPIMLFLRIIIFKHITFQMRNQIINPLNQLVYFFVQHQKLDELFHYYAIM